MNLTPYLFQVPKTNPSNKDKLKAFKSEHGIETHYAKGFETAWMAVHLPSARKFGYGVTEESDLFDCVAHVGRLLDESGVAEYGVTEKEAIKRLCINVGITFNI